MKSIRESGIYQIGSKIVLNKYYIGSSNYLHRRKGNHFYSLKLNKHNNQYLQDWYNKYGLDDIEFKIIKICPVSELLRNEQYFIDLLNPDFNIQKVASRKGNKIDKEEACKYIAFKDMGRTGQQLIENERSILNKMKFLNDVFRSIIDEDIGTLKYRKSFEIDKPLNLISDNDERNMLLKEIKIKYNISDLKGFDIIHEVSNNILRELLVFGEHKCIISKYL